MSRPKKPGVAASAEEQAWMLVEWRKRWGRS